MGKNAFGTKAAEKVHSLLLCACAVTHRSSPCLPVADINIVSAILVTASCSSSLLMDDPVDKEMQDCSAASCILQLQMQIWDFCSS